MLNAARNAIWRREWANVIELVSKAIASKDVPENRLAGAYELRAAAYLRKNKYREAIADTDRVINASPTFKLLANGLKCAPNATAYRTRGIAYAGLYQFEQANSDLSCAIAQESPSISFCWYFDRGQINEMNGQNDRAAADYAKAGSLDPDRARQLYCVGVTKRELGDISGALYIARAMALNPRVVEDMQSHGNYGF